VAVIDEEAERLQRRVKDLLYLTKLDQLSVSKAAAVDINIAELVKHVVELMRWQRTDLEWKVQVEPIMFKGDADQWKIALENLLDNQIRYAAGRICISSSRQIKNGKSGLTLRIANDGPPIEEKLLNSLFMEYEKGFKGQFGLGLAIVQQIAVSHGARVWAANEDESPAFYIELEI